MASLAVLYELMLMCLSQPHKLAHAPLQIHCLKIISFNRTALFLHSPAVYVFEPKRKPEADQLQQTQEQKNGAIDVEAAAAEASENGSASAAELQQQNGSNGAGSQQRQRQKGGKKKKKTAGK